MSELSPALELRAVTRCYTEGKGQLEVFRDLNLIVRPGEIVALVGQSGSGKSSLLHIAGLLEAPTAGEVLIAGRNCSALDDKARTRIRRIGIGFVYQFHHLLPEFSALENVMMPQLIAGQNRAAAALRARELLERLGLAARLEHRPAELSGGEQQRVAIARALVHKPKLLVCDEPTSALDHVTGQKVMELLRVVATAHDLSLVVVTHDQRIFEFADRIAEMDDGHITRMTTGMGHKVAEHEATNSLGT